MIWNRVMVLPETGVLVSKLELVKATVLNALMFFSARIMIGERPEYVAVFYLVGIATRNYSFQFRFQVF